jgi:hypothetical protein
MWTPTALAALLTISTVQNIGVFQSAEIDGMTITTPELTSGWSLDLGNGSSAGGVCIAGNRAPIGTIELPCSDGVSLPSQISFSFANDQIVDSLLLVGRSTTGDPEADLIFRSGDHILTSTLGMLGGKDSGIFTFQTQTQQLGWFLPAGQPLTISSQFNGSMDVWLREVTVREVPGPVGFLGLGAMYTWSRKLRRRCRKV